MLPLPKRITISPSSYLASFMFLQAANIADALLHPRDPHAPPQADPVFQEEYDDDGNQAAQRVVELPGPAVTPVQVVTRTLLCLRSTRMYPDACMPAVLRMGATTCCTCCWHSMRKARSG
jgi:hypothetical protein